MKKILLATSILAATSGFAAAEVTIGGMARFGLTYNSEATDNKTIISNRVQFNLTGTTTTDGGVDLGARLRFRYNDGDTNTTGNTGLFWATYEGVTVEVGNVNTGFDSAPLMWDSEMGFEKTSFGDPQEIAFAYKSQGSNNLTLVDTDGDGVVDAIAKVRDNYMGVSVAYAMGGFSGMLSVVDPNQLSDSTLTTKTETSLFLAYASGAFSVSLAGYENGAGFNNNDGFFVGAAYAINDAATVGLNFADEDLSTVGKITTLYGNYAMGQTTLRAYIADASGNNSTLTGAIANPKTAYGLGADYDLGGGATLMGSVQRGFEKETLADVGISFAF